jgi:hypothetical protein
LHAPVSLIFTNVFVYRTLPDLHAYCPIFVVPKATFLVFFIVPMPAIAVVGLFAAYDIYKASTVTVRYIIWNPYFAVCRQLTSLFSNSLEQLIVQVILVVPCTVLHTGSFECGHYCELVAGVCKMHMETCTLLKWNTDKE